MSKPKIKKIGMFWYSSEDNYTISFSSAKQAENWDFVKNKPKTKTNTKENARKDD